MLSFLAPILLRLSPIGSTLRAVPKPVWEALAVLGYVLALYALHQHYARQHDAALIAANNAQWQAKLNAEVAKMSAMNAQNAQMANQLRKANDEEHNRIAADAGSLLMRGPGKAACPGLPAAPAAPVRPQQATPKTGLALAPVPDTGGEQLVALPFAPTVRAFTNGDECFADRRSVDQWYDNLVKAWPKQPAK